MRKKYLLILSLIFSLMVFVSCTVQSGVITIGSLDSGKDYIKGNYEKFNGEYYKMIKLKKGDKIELSTNFNTKNGEIKLLLLDKDENEVLDLKNTTSFEVLDDGYYYFKAIAENHSGDFEMKWNIKE
ncbi:hypothetical protein [Clostridium sp.]|uniref:hypothetical protein n=1 Tax=Clostridium sp. TaxID=1506 RepID=UPI003F378D43